MNGILKATDTTQLEPNWTHPTIPGQAVQGSLLFTTTDFVEPPQSSNVMKWIPMEDIVGLGNVKSEYDEKTDTITLYKTRQHLNSDGEYEYDWVAWATIQNLPEETVEMLNNMEYLRYYFEITDKSIKFTGKKKDGTIDDLGTFQVYSISEIDDKVKTINETIQKEVNDRTNADTALKTDYTNLINAETNARTAADTTIKTEIDQKTQYAIQYALNVVNNLNKEIEERKSNDTDIRQSITDETTERTNQDFQLNQTITANYSELKAKIEAISGSAIKTKVVDEKPTTPENNTMYYVKTGDNTYELWLYSDNTWYDMGSTQVDFSNYYTKSEVDTKETNLQSKITSNENSIKLIKSGMTIQSGRITTLENQYIDLATQVDTNKENIETNANNIATINTNLANMTTTIQALQTAATKQKVIAGAGITTTETDTGTTVALSGSDETWTFTLSDGSTVNRKVRIF